MSTTFNTNKKLKAKKTGRYATAEKAAKTKNSGLIAHIKKLNVKVEKCGVSPK